MSSLLSESPTSAAPAPAEIEPTFEHRLNRKLGSDGGAPLPSDVASHAGATFGTDLGNVRVHSDSESAQMAESKGFQAFSYGADVFTKPGATDTSTADGSHVMMHELAHVAQSGGQRAAGVHGKAQIGTSTDANEALELDADRGATAALHGGTHQVQSAPLMVRGFGATAGKDKKTGERNKNDIVHENQTRNAAEKVGFDERDSEMIYSGNWQRDMNQFLIPKMRSAGPIIFSAMDLMHTLHFGFPIAGSKEAADKPGNGPGVKGVKEFGTYDAVEHLDNPGGLTGKDVNKQRGADGADVDNANGASDSENIGKDDQSLADADSRYNEQFKRVMAAAKNADGSAKAEADAIENPGETSDAFKVDESGIPIYMQTSRYQLIEQLKKGLDLAASKAGNKQENYDRALRYCGEALHVMQDYYAHSNFCEVALNMLMDEKFSGDKVDSKGGNATFVQALNLSAIDPALADPKTTKHHLNSYVHRKGADGKAESGNMTTKGGREVMATGTFTLEDTAQSIKEKVGLALKGINPFAAGGPAGPSEKTMRLITWFESNPTYFPMDGASAGQWCGEKLQAVMPAIDVLTKGGSMMMGAQGAVSSAADKGWGKVKGLWHSAWGDDEAAEASENQGNADAAKHEADAQRRKETLAKLNGELHKTAAMLAGGGSLRALYQWTYDAGSHMKLSSLARMIPLVGDQVAEVVDKVVKEIKEWLRSQFEAAWLSATAQFTAEFNAAVSLALGSSEVSDKTGSQTMTQPTHTDIAKDFDSHQHGTEDRFSIIEEVGEFMNRLGGAKAAGTKVLDMAKAKFNDVMSGKTGVIDGVKSATAEIAKEVNGPESEEAGHKHQHRHAGAWLAPIAHSLATQSSEKILEVYRAGLKKGQAGQSPSVEKTGVATVTHAWFAHPADCTGLWQSDMMSMLSGDTVDAIAIKKELARRMALPPEQQSTNDESTTNHDDRHGDHDDGDSDHGAKSEFEPGPHTPAGHGPHDHEGHDHHDHDHE